MNKKKILIIIFVFFFILFTIGIALSVFFFINFIKDSSQKENVVNESTEEDILDRLTGSVTLVDLQSLPEDTIDHSSYKSYYVSTSGNDNDAGTLDKPFATISHALDVAGEKSQIFVRGGNYQTKNLQIIHSDFTLSAYEDEEVVLTQKVVNDEWDIDEDLAILLDGDLDDVEIDGFTIDGFEEGIIYGDPATQENIILKNIKIKGANIGIGNTYPEHEKYLVEKLLIKNVTMTNITGIGLQCGDENDKCAKDVLVQNVQVFGAENNENDTGYDSLAMVESDNVLVVDSTFTNAPGDGLDFKSTRVAVVNTVVGNPNRNGIKFWHEGEIINCISYATGADANIVFESETSGSTFRMVNSIVAQHLYDLPENERHAYAMTIGYDSPLDFNVELVNNIFYDMPGPIYINSQSLANIHNNIFYKFIHDNRFLVYGENELNDVTLLNQKDFASGNRYLDPLFTDPATADWTLKSESPAIDAGLDKTGVPDFDIKWNDRPKGSGVDIGAYEI